MLQVVAGISGQKASVTAQGTCAHAPVCVSKCTVEQQPTSIAAGEDFISRPLLAVLTCWLWPS
jgi:hypothetical protein